MVSRQNTPTPLIGKSNKCHVFFGNPLNLTMMLKRIAIILPCYDPAMTRWTGSPGGIFADGTAWTLSVSRQGRQSSSHKIIILLLSHFCRIHSSTIYNRKIKDIMIYPPREENEFLKQRMINGLIRFFWTSGRSKLSKLSKLSKSASEALILSETQYPTLILLFKDV